MLFWNVRGTNDPAKRSVIRDFLGSLHVSIVCISETKVSEVDEFYIAQCLGLSFDGFVFLPANETRGGVIMAWYTSVIQIGHVSYDTYAITGEVTARDESKWWLTTVYGPQGVEDKIVFLEELTERRSLCPGPWVVAGDFNMILNASEKNNENLDRNMMQ
jgi:exonuclease III